MGLDQTGVFLNCVLNKIMTIDSKMFSCLFIQFFWIDWFAVFDDDMYFFYTWEMCFKNVSSIV